MAKKKVLDKQHALAEAMLKKCQELGCTDANDCANLIGAATLIALNIFGEYIGCPFEDMRKEYVRGLLAAEIEG